MKTASAKAKGKCRRCKQVYDKPTKEHRICSTCRAQCVSCGVMLDDDTTLISAAKRNQYYCKSCVADKVKKTKTISGKLKKDWQKEYDLKRHYGLDLKTYNKLTRHGCAICGSLEKLCIDHDHNTGKVRGCLCSKCNTAIGMLNDDKESLKNAYEYLT